MFYTAMRAADVPDPKAKQMYAAVYAFGPKWVLREVKKTFHPPTGGHSKGGISMKREHTVIVPVPMLAPLSEENPDDKAKFEQINQRIEAENLSLDEIEVIVQTES